MFSIIVAHNQDNIIGKNNKLPWYIPDDLKRFKELTIDKKIIMGRKTFESVPKVLPKRKHLVLTTNKNFLYIDENVEIITDFKKLIKEYENSKEEVFIIGGGEIYNLFLPYSKKLYITEVNFKIDGDTSFPEFDKSKWSLDFQSEIFKYENIEYCYKNYLRK